MKVAIHQPEYWPIPRLLAKWAAADLLVVLDIVQFDRSSLQHRARLQSTFDLANRWLTIPFIHIGTPQQIRVLEPADPDWAEKHWARIKDWYRAAEPARMETIGAWFKLMHSRSGEAISNYTVESMRFLGAILGIETPIMLASSMFPPAGGWGGKSDLVLNLCKSAGADVYLSGVRGATYLDWTAFERSGISTEVQAYRHPQAEPELSALHTYLDHGTEALNDLCLQRRLDA